MHSGTLEYFLDEHIEKCSINIFWLLSQAVKLRQHGIDCAFKNLVQPGGGDGFRPPV